MLRMLTVRSPPNRTGPSEFLSGRKSPPKVAPGRGRDAPQDPVRHRTEL